jgi:hypothetical protein
MYSNRLQFSEQQKGVPMELHEFLVPEINEAKAKGFENGLSVTTEKALNIGDGFLGLLLRVTAVVVRTDSAIEGLRDGEIHEKCRPVQENNGGGD